MKLHFNFIDWAIDTDLHLVTAPKSLQPGYRLARNSCPNSTVAMAGMQSEAPFCITTNSAGDNHTRLSRRQSLVVKLESLIYTTQW